MNKYLAIILVTMYCSAVSMAALSHYHSGYKTHLGGAAYGYHHPAAYVSHGYRKPVLHHAPVHHAPVVYAHKSYSKPHATHYIKPSYHHEVPHVGHYHSKPVHYLGGHVPHHGVVYKPALSHGYHGHGAVYAAKSYHHH